MWVLTAVLVAGIYATLGVAGRLASELGERQLLDGIFFTAFVVMVAALVATARRVRIGTPEIGVLVAATAAIAVLIVRLGIPAAERTHLVEYAVVALLIHEALIERRRHDDAVRRPGLWAAVGASVVGVVDECLQALIPNRVFDPVDIAFNTAAACLAVTVVAILRRRLPSRP